jgi:aspartate/methionine/tyrosine aminotransferase
MPAHFSGRLPWPSPSNALSLALSERRKRGLPVTNFVESNPTKVGLARDEGLLAALASPRGLSYSPDPRGLLAAREALCADLDRRFPGLAPEPENLFLCASTSEAYGWLFKLLCEAGDAVLVPKPGYPLFDFLAGLEAVEARSYRLGYAHPAGWRIDLDSMEAALAKGRAKAIVLINPNNPTGSYLREAERRAIIDLASRWGASLIVDEVFFGFPLEAAERATFLGESRVPTFVLDGLSKLLGLPQLKLGWMAASGPAPLLSEATGRLEIIADTYLSAGTPVMTALPRLLQGREQFVDVLGGRLRANLASLRGILEGPGSPHRVLTCGGGWTALVESPRLASEEDLALGLLEEEGLLVHPGYYFDMEREAFFATSLILEPGAFRAAALCYSAYFARLLSTS